MKKALTAERRNKLARMLVTEGSIKISEMAKQFGVSKETIRKDIIWLENRGLAQKSHGGAVAKSDMVENTIDDKQELNAEAKAKIARAAVELIPPGGAVILDTGSTNAAIAKEISLMKDLTIFTNSLTIAQILAPSDNKVYMMGGRVRPSSRAAVGSWSSFALNAIFADIAFLGSDGFYDVAGPTALSYSEAEFKKQAVSSATQVYTVADNSKFNTSGLFAYTDWGCLTGLITDDEAPEKMVESLRNKTDVIIAK